MRSASALDAGTRARVTLIGQTAAMPDLVVMGSHCVALDVVLGALAERGLQRAHDRGRQPWAAWRRPSAANAISRRCISSIPRAASTTRICCAPGLALVKGWQRMQGFVYRPDDARFAGRERRRTRSRPRSPTADCLMVNRNAGAGTRVLIDRLLARRAARRATAISRARTTPSPPRWRRAAPTGASRSSRWRGSTASGFSRSRPRTTIFFWSKAAATVPAVAGVPGGAARRGVRENIRALGMRPADA